MDESEINQGLEQWQALAGELGKRLILATGKPEGDTIELLDALIQERNRLKAALEDIQAMTRPVERTVTTGGEPLLWTIHAIAAKALKGE